VLYGDLNHLEKFIELTITNRVRSVIQEIRGRLESEGKAYQEDWYLEMAKSTQLSRQELEAWESILAARDDKYQKVRFPSRAQRGDASGDEVKIQSWLFVIQSARRRWMKIDGVKDKQRKIKEDFLKADLDLDEVLQEASNWENKPGIQQTMFKILFVDARFRPPKKK
jgi:hypothetical protein